MAGSRLLSILASVTRWIARVCSILFALLVLLMAIDGGPAALLQPPTLLDGLAYASIAVSALALLAAWKWEAIGGAVAIAAGLAMQVFVLAFGTWDLRALTGVLILGGPGALYLASWALRRSSPAAT